MCVIIHGDYIPCNVINTMLFKSRLLRREYYYPGHVILKRIHAIECLPVCINNPFVITFPPISTLLVHDIPKKNKLTYAYVIQVTYTVL